ncbi:hypothetical protein J592_03818 [Acinetobacter baumannii 655378]|nr:hypothetical protein J592_03818 [Acinetobacter baumannii 655378]
MIDPLETGLCNKAMIERKIEIALIDTALQVSSYCKYLEV